MKYIFIAGAPGSKWSSVSKNFYYSPNIDRTDYSEARTYYHDAPGEMMLMHMGAYFDPGMEFDLPSNLEEFSREELERMFDAPFSGVGTRIIKSHIFCHHIEFLKKTWPDCPIVTVYRSDDACLGWWVKCGHFDITYPKYNKYYIDLKHMAVHIKNQNADMLKSLHNIPSREAKNNVELCNQLGIERPPEEYYQNYPEADIKVNVI